MYHCGTPMILEHIASGMYGAVVVEPREGYPDKADREYVIVQSEFYARPDPGGAMVDGAPLYVLDGERLRAAQPTYTVFNGVHNGMVRNPLPAKPGERVRLYVLNVGPSRTSSFHVVGTIFDKVWIEGNPENQFRGMQTVLLGSSNSAIVEFMVPEAGSYIMVDHHFANASQGAIGLISAGAAGPAAGIEHHNMAATATPATAGAVRGKLNFESKCLACHSIGQGDKLGPDLAGVTRRRSEAWLSEWLRAPGKMLASDPDARALLARFNNIPMPDQGLSAAEVAELLEYFRWADAQPAPPAAGSMGH
jgi:nitrite reductase (NO-forming)